MTPDVRGRVTHAEMDRIVTPRLDIAGDNTHVVVTGLTESGLVGESVTTNQGQTRNP
jgi:hypothetical protein